MLYLSVELPLPRNDGVECSRRLGVLDHQHESRESSAHACQKNLSFALRLR